MARTRSSKVTKPELAESPKRSARTLKKDTKSKPAPKLKAAVSKIEDTPSQDLLPASTIQQTNSIVNSDATKKAVDQLFKFIERNEKATKDAPKKSLFDDEDSTDADNAVFLLFHTKKFYSERQQFKPKVLPLRHAIYDRESTRTCLIIRDSLASTATEIEALEAADLPTVKHILPIQSLKKEYKEFEKRRQLYRDYDMFIVDDAVLNLMPTLLGKTFYSNGRKKAAFPVRVTNSKNHNELSTVTLKNQLEKCLNSTFFLPPVSTNVVVKIGHIKGSTTQQDLVENAEDVIQSFDPSSLVSVMIKTTTSPSLPLWYTEKLYDESDVTASGKSDALKLDAAAEAEALFQRGLLELAGPLEVAKALASTNPERSKLKA